jgi:uncharacterized protein YjbJ (UPF0337 family)
LLDYIVIQWVKRLGWTFAFSAAGKGLRFESAKMEIEMNWDQIRGNWNQLKGKAQKEWGKLTDDDMKVIDAELTQLIGRIQEHYGYTREQAEKAVADWYDRIHASAGDLAAPLSGLQKDVARLAESVSKLVQHQVQGAGLRFSEGVGDAGDKIARTATDAQDRIRSGTGELGASIERNPLTAVLIALGVGLSLGMMSRLRE